MVRLTGELQRKLWPSLVERIERRYAQVVAEALTYHEASRRWQSAAEATGAQEAPPGTQPRVAAEGLPGVDAAFPTRVRRPGHPQPGGAGHADEEGTPEDFRRVLVRAGVQDFATLRSVLSSAGKQGRNRLKALRRGPEVLFAALAP